MTTTSKITSAHLQKTAFVYIRQSSMGQVKHHRESTERQYALQETARSLGWHENETFDSAYPARLQDRESLCMQRKWAKFRDILRRYPLVHARSVRSEFRHAAKP